MSLGEMLDGLACGVGGHIWIQRNGIEDVMTCSRCGAQAEQPAVESESDESESIVPEARPWLDPPFMVTDI
jgi:hypothetical protein